MIILISIIMIFIIINIKFKYLIYSKIKIIIFCYHNTLLEFFWLTYIGWKISKETEMCGDKSQNLKSNYQRHYSYEELE